MVEGLLQPTHLILILAIVLIVFGPGKLTDVGTQLGKGMRELRRAMDNPDEQLPPPGADASHQSPPGPTST